MSLLAIDIETASPYGEPNNLQNTDKFEPVAIGLGYQPRPGAPIESDVLFREGDWDIYHTTDLLTRVSQWVREHDPNYAITYNGDNFDKVHLLNWARQADSEYSTTGLEDTFETIFDNHIDLIRPATELYGESSSYLKLEDALAEVGVTVSETAYNDYNLPPELTQQVSNSHVQNTDIGRVLGEAFVNYIAAPDQPNNEYSELAQLLYDYTIEDIDPLFELAEDVRQAI